ncbi:MAG: homocysteine S-methyltransferase [Micavibrio sp.]|nr:homocysteine S-methyltransferase [Micavibrio sp.]|tara:strand:- start:1975 stop:2901 length:927 start_codon:yes stop_codon:yes gene_type:complete
MTQRYILLDGGMGRELERMGAPFKQPEWSALALMEAPDSVYQAHINFIESGAEVITTNAYAVIPYHIGEERFNSDGRALIKLSAQLARKAANTCEPPIKVAGCIPPLFGSYMPERFSAADAKALLLPFIEEQEQYVDFWLIETISSIEEAVLIHTLLDENTDKPIWMAFTITAKEESDGDKNPLATLRSHEPIKDAVQALIVQTNPPEAILYNCCQPEEVELALKTTNELLKAADMAHIKTGAYSNAFTKVKKRRLPSNQGVNALRKEMTPRIYLSFAKKWRKQGASIIGGCCGIGPEHIQALKKGLK